MWLADDLGLLPLRAVARELVEVSRRLDTIAAKGVDFCEKRARNILSVVSAMFRDAYSSNDRSLRVLDVNPCADVPSPERPATKAFKQLLNPNDFSPSSPATTFRSCERVSTR
jgi:hypothetical protein